MTKENILYVHGFGSKFNKNSENIKSLDKEFNVFGIDVDYSLPYNEIVDKLKNAVYDYGIDLIIGTSLGGYFANVIGNLSGIPFVMINPSHRPKYTLKKYLDMTEDYYGNPLHLKKENLKDFKSMEDRGEGLLLLDMNDEVLNSDTTLSIYSKFKTVTFEGGSHRFDHIEEALPHIKEFINHHFTRL